MEDLNLGASAQELQLFAREKVNQCKAIIAGYKTDQ
jgi:hypothetical protein